MEAWSPRCLAYFRQAPVDPYVLRDRGGHDEAARRTLDMLVSCEMELMALAGGRGLPRIGSVLLGASARHEGRDPIARDENGVPRALFGWGPETGRMWLDLQGYVRVERPRFSVQDGLWRQVVERLVLRQTYKTWIPDLCASQLTQVDRFFWAADHEKRKPLGALAQHLNLQLDPWASSSDPDTYVGDGVLVWHLQGIECVVQVKAISMLEHVLQACMQLGLIVWMDMSKCPVAPLVLEEGQRFGAKVYERRSPFGAIHISLGEPVAVKQEIALFGEQFESAIVAPSFLCKKVAPLRIDASPRLLAFLESKRAFRTTHRFPEAELAPALERAGVPPWPCLFELEREVGGLLWPHRSDPLGRPELIFGLSLSWNAPAVLLEDWSREPEDDEEGPRPVRPARFPMWSWNDMPLVFVGECYNLLFLLCDELGRIWEYDEEIGLIRLGAGKARTFLEILALDHQIKQKALGYASVNVPSAEVGGGLARELGLAPIVEASDQVVQCYEGNGLWLRQYQAAGPKGAALRLQCNEVGRLVEATRRAVELRGPGAAVTVQTGAPGGQARLDALKAAGLDAR